MYTNAKRLARLSFLFIACVIVFLMMIGLRGAESAAAETFNISCTEETKITEFREAIVAANDQSGTHTIVLSPNCLYEFSSPYNDGSSTDNALDLAPYPQGVI